MKSKQVKPIILMLAISLIVIYCVSNYNRNKNMSAKNICQADECNNKCVEYYVVNSKFTSSYCEDHICVEEDCYDGKDFSASGDGKYCVYHESKHANDIILSDLQIKQARKVVDEYCKTLISKQKNILNVNMISDTPETSSLYIEFSCNVVREDSKTNPATIYVSIQENGSFKVDKLSYD